MSGATVWASRLGRGTLMAMTATILEHQHFGRRSVAIAHRGRLVRAALRALLEADAGVVVLGEAGDGEAALAMALRLRPDVVVVDESLPGLELVTGSSAAVIVVREDGDPAEVIRALRLGARTHKEENMLPPNVVEIRRGSAHGTVSTRAKPRRRQARGLRLVSLPALPARA
jgi:DNA-binding NarL/FixJ family response regulator